MIIISNHNSDLGVRLSAVDNLKVGNYVWTLGCLFNTKWILILQATGTGDGWNIVRIEEIP